MIQAIKLICDRCGYSREYATVVVGQTITHVCIGPTTRR